MKKNIVIIFCFTATMMFSQDWGVPADPGFGGGSSDPATEPDLAINIIDTMLLITGLVVGVIYYKRNKRLLSK